MDAYVTDAADFSHFALPPVLVVGTSEAAAARGAASVAAAGLRIAATLPLDEAQARFEKQGRATAAWIEIDEDCGGAMDALLELVARDVRGARYAAVVSTSADILDPVIARIDDPRIEIVVNGDGGARAAALATALAQHRIEERVGDVAADKNAERLRQLSEEVGRIASALARLSSGPGAAPLLPREPGSEKDVPAVSVETVRSVIRARRMRARFFAEDLFADPAWDMMLDLLQAEIAQLRVPVSSLCIAAAVPATTALRWLKTMVAQGLFIRRADPHDGRRVFVELAPATSHSLRRYFAEVGQVAVI
jgi:DNA-binding MarR family transcriptional regulator